MQFLFPLFFLEPQQQHVTTAKMIPTTIAVTTTEMTAVTSGVTTPLMPPIVELGVHELSSVEIKTKVSTLC